MSLHFGLFLVQQEVIHAEDLIRVQQAQIDERPPIGEVAIRKRILSLKQVFGILRRQAECDAPFGRIAREMGFLSEVQLAQLLFHQSENQPTLASLLVRTGVLSETEVRRQRELFQASKRLDERGDEAGIQPLSRSDRLESFAPVPELADLGRAFSDSAG